MTQKLREISKATHDLRGALAPAWMLLQRKEAPSETELAMIRESVVQTMREVNEMHTRALASAEKAVDEASEDV